MGNLGRIRPTGEIHRAARCNAESRTLATSTRMTSSVKRFVQRHCCGWGRGDRNKEGGGAVVTWLTRGRWVGFRGGHEFEIETRRTQLEEKVYVLRALGTRSKSEEVVCRCGNSEAVTMLSCIEAVKKGSGPSGDLHFSIRILSNDALDKHLQDMFD